MKLETIKSFILTILIGTSFLLSFVIWNYQPPYGPLHSKYLNEVDIGGGEMTKRTIIQPRSVVFHVNNKVYQYPETVDQKLLYENIQEWPLTNLSVIEPPNLEDSNKFVEVTFPLTIQLSMLPNLFTIVEDDLPGWSFQQMIIVPNDQYESLDVYFISTHGGQAVQFTLNDHDIYTDITAIFQREHRLTKLLTFETDRLPVYFPEKPVKMKRRSLAIESIDPALLVNALFINPSLVSHTIGEANYNDGQRMMNVLNDGRSMEFTNPIHSKEHLSFEELLNLSIKDINEHKGWTNDFILDSANLASKRLQYKMYFEGYPVYSHEDYSMIEQRWEGQDLYQYKRPLFRLSNILNSEQVTLPSGKEVIRYLEESENYLMSNITDIQLAYRLKYEDISFSVTLEPTWYINYNDRWYELVIETLEMKDKEGM